MANRADQANLGRVCKDAIKNHRRVTHYVIQCNVIYNNNNNKRFTDVERVLRQALVNTRIECAIHFPIKIHKFELLRSIN